MPCEKLFDQSAPFTTGASSPLVSREETFSDRGEAGSRDP